MAKFITKFNTTAEFATFSATTNFGKPHVSLIKDDSKVHYFEDPYKGHEYVDLGLPSKTKWATMNVGASSETDYGNYYQYGKGAAQYAATSVDSDYSGIEEPLAASADTAVQVWGGSWHMPTRAQMKELTANTTYEWVTNYKGSGINGGTFTAKNGAVLFLPAAGQLIHGNPSSVGSGGYYWGSSPSESEIYMACDLFFYDNSDDSEYGKAVGDFYRNYGNSVRPVAS